MLYIVKLTELQLMYKMIHYGSIRLMSKGIMLESNLPSLLFAYLMFLELF